MARTTAEASTPRRSPADTRRERRKQLADSALTTLGELGYARTSLREIANNSEFSHGVLHYYFADKLELIVYCVRHYQSRCVTRYDAVASDSGTAQGLLDAFCAKLVDTLQHEPATHRLWYDLRTQSMFEDDLREAVTMIDTTLQQMIWRVLSRYAELSGAAVAMTPAAAYGMLDGLVQQALLGHVAGRPEALTALVEHVRAVMPLMLAPRG